MLKIKDNVDLMLLEKFGFKKRYDQDTGNLIAYYHRHFEYVYVYLKDRKLNASYSELVEEEKIQDLLYDLIQTGLIEKVEENGKI